MIFEFRADFGLYLGIALYELLFGFFYDRLTAQFEKKGYLEGFVSLQVAVGVLFTLLPFLIFRLPAWTTVGGFVLSGAPMIYGSISRYIKNRERAQQELARLHSYDDDPTGMAGKR